MPTVKDQTFYINAIKMDLRRAFHMGADITREFPKETALTFLNHALKDMARLAEEENHTFVRKNIEILINNIDSVENNLKYRLQWAEKVMDMSVILS